MTNVGGSDKMCAGEDVRDRAYIAFRAMEPVTTLGRA
jgi:hypothetical protein